MWFGGMMACLPWKLKRLFDLTGQALGGLVAELSLQDLA